MDAVSNPYAPGAGSQPPELAGRTEILERTRTTLARVKIGRPILKSDVEAASALARKNLDESFFRVRFDRLTPREKGYLFAMAKPGRGPHRSGDIAAELRVTVESIAAVRNSLIKKGMVFSPAHGDTAFTVPLVDEYLQRLQA